jgi:hypothetical protein
MKLGRTDLAKVVSSSGGHEESLVQSAVRFHACVAFQPTVTQAGDNSFLHPQLLAHKHRFAGELFCGPPLDFDADLDEQNALWLPMRLVKPSLSEVRSCFGSP